jgi:hypothetical protein
MYKVNEEDGPPSRRCFEDVKASSYSIKVRFELNFHLASGLIWRAFLGSLTCRIIRMA